jgi:hypothetical protein
MPEYPDIPKPNVHRTRQATALRIVAVILTAATLAGCDACGDWKAPWPGSTAACRQQAPLPR